MSNSARSTSSSASSASPSSPPAIPMDTQLPQSMSNSSLSTSSSASLASPSSPPVIPMDQQQRREFFKVCVKGDFSLCINLMDANPHFLLSTNPHMNNCLHIAAVLGHEEFAKEVWSRAPSLFSGINDDGETPLIVALMAANLSLASDIITAATQYMQHDDLEEGRSLSHMLLKVDRRHENVLHHAMRNGFENLALRLLEIEPQLSVQATNTGESPMYMAVRRGYSNIIERLLQITFSTDSGPADQSSLNAAVLSGNTGSLLISPNICMHFFILIN